LSREVACQVTYLHGYPTHMQYVFWPRPEAVPANRLTVVASLAILAISDPEATCGGRWIGHTNSGCVENIDTPAVHFLLRESNSV